MEKKLCFGGEAWRFFAVSRQGVAQGGVFG
jgi:hypothetical protein